jgi:hypothetical protein
MRPRISAVSEYLSVALGEPHRKLPPANNATNYMYFLGKADQFPYLAATVKANRVIALRSAGWHRPPATASTTSISAAAPRN